MSSDFYIGVTMGMLLICVLGIVFLLFEEEDEQNKRRKQHDRL